MFRAVIVVTAFALLSCSGQQASQKPSSSAPYEEQLRADKTGNVRKEIFQSFQTERSVLVARLQQTPGRAPITDKKTLEVIRKVPRHAFVRPDYRDERAYWDRGLPIEMGQIISQPYIVATMMELLDVQKDDKVLEIGTGSGYQAGLLAEITLHVYTIEILKPLEEKAEERLNLLGYTSVHVRAGDGYFGWPEEAPFTAIIVTAAAGHIPPPLLEQLAPGGRMVIPVGDPYGVQRLILVTKDSQGNLKTEDHMPVQFVPMTGSGTGH